MSTPRCSGLLALIRARGRRADRARPAPRAAAPGAHPHRSQAPALAQSRRSPPTARLAADGGRRPAARMGRASRRPRSRSAHAGDGFAFDNEGAAPPTRCCAVRARVAPGDARRVRGVHRRRRLPASRAVAVARLGRRCRAAAGRRRSTGSAATAHGGRSRCTAWSRSIRTRRLPRQLLRGRCLRALGRRTAADRIRVGARSRAACPSKATSSKAARCIRCAPREPTPPGQLAQLFGDVWEWTRSELRAVPGLSRRRRRGRRVQRQVHVQPVRAARRLVRDAAHRTSARPTAISSRPTRAGSSRVAPRASTGVRRTTVQSSRSPKSRSRDDSDRSETPANRFHCGRSTRVEHREVAARSCQRRTVESPRLRAASRTRPARTCTSSRCGCARPPRRRASRRRGAPPARDRAARCISMRPCASS